MIDSMSQIPIIRRFGGQLPSAWCAAMAHWLGLFSCPQCSEMRAYATEISRLVQSGD